MRVALQVKAAMTTKHDHAVQLQVKLEFGHSASCRKKPTPEGFTHDWTVFVRGPDNKDISHFVDKVVFHLHDSFPKPKRVFKDPPYKIEEHGYGSFNLPIDVYFKNKEEPKKVRIDYDLFLPAMGLPAIDNIRSEALKFINPPEEFKRKVLKAGGVIGDSTNCINGSAVLSNNTNINGNANGNHNLHNGKEMRKESKEEKPTTANEIEKMKKTKTDKMIASKPPAKIPNILNKRPSNSSEEELHIVKKKKKKSDDISTAKPTGFIPIEPLPAGSDEHDTVLDNKDVKLKIKSLPAKVSSKKSDKATDKLIEKIKEKKKDKHNDASLADNSVSKNSTKRRNSSNSKTKEKPLKSPPEAKPKPLKVEERKLEKITFRRESGDSWSSSRSNSPGLYTSVLSSSINNKNNALGTLMAELSDQDDDDDNNDDDDDDDDLDLSTPFQSDSMKPKTDSNAVQNNNVLNKKDSSKAVKEKSKSKAKELPSKKAGTKHTQSSSSTKDVTKSPVKTSKTEPVRTSFSKNSPKTKLKEGRNGHQIPHMELVHLHKQLSSIKDGKCLQKVVDILEHSGCFVITETTLDFDLYKLDSATIKQIQHCIER